MLGRIRLVWNITGEQESSDTVSTPVKAKRESHSTVGLDQGIGQHV
ncbi:MAG: hypothetical protein ACJARU_000357 [Congregibacter sp.]|jgi:hypothetical protein